MKRTSKVRFANINKQGGWTFWSLLFVMLVIGFFSYGEFGNVKNGKKRYHELAIELLRGKMSYPTVVFLDEKMELIQAIVGFKSPRQFEKIATYFGSDYYRKTPWSAFQKSYKTILTAD